MIELKGQNMRVGVIGGTGKSGKYLVSHLIQKGIDLRLVVRNPEGCHIRSPLAQIIQGDARRFESIRSLVDGCEAIISTLGQPKGEPTIFSQSARNVIRAMTESGIRRYIVTTGLNVDVSSDNKSQKTRFATDWMKQNYPETTFDKQAEYDTLMQSDINWTLVRLPLIEQTEERRPILVSLEDCPGDTIGASDLASFLADQLADKSYIRKAPFIANVAAGA